MMHPTDHMQATVQRARAVLWVIQWPDRNQHWSNKSVSTYRPTSATWLDPRMLCMRYKQQEWMCAGRSCEDHEIQADGPAMQGRNGRPHSCNHQMEEPKGPHSVNGAGEDPVKLGRG
jgi:hypothetical protein